MEEEFLRDFIHKIQCDGELYQKFYSALRAGDTRLFHNLVTERFTLNEDWVNTIDAALYSIELIVRNPRRFIKDEENIVAVERAKRTNAKTIRHLSANTQHIQSIKGEDVRPKKVLVTEIDEDVAIYENRFVCALIERLTIFVEQRYRDIGDKAKNVDTTGLNLRTAFTMGKNKFECKLDIKVKEPSHDYQAYNRLMELIEKVENIRMRLQILRKSDFYREISKAKPVKPPIQKTNLLRMNVDYHNCYRLWLFISAYKTVGFSVDVSEKNLPVDGDYFDDLTVVSALAIQSLVVDGVINRNTYDLIPLTKRVEHDYKVVTSYKYLPDFGADKSETHGEDAVNEYYFHKMRDDLVRATRRNQVVEQKELDLNFQHFFKSIAKINGEMYKDIITSEYEKLPKGRSEIQKKQASVNNQKTLLRRYHQLARLQKYELEKTLRLEKRELLKLEKLQADLNKTKRRRIDKIEADKKKRKKLEKLSNQVLDAEVSANAYERELRGLEAAKQVQIEEEKQRRREEAKRARELKKYQELKEKFDGEEE